MATTRARREPAPAAWPERVPLGHTLDGELLPPVRRRLLPATFRSDMAWGWYGPLFVTLFVGIFQFWGLATPHKITFDETYYAKDAYSLLVRHYASTFVDNPATDKVNEADQIINSGSTKNIFADAPSMVVHPEVGKWMIAVGEWIFGLTPFGWRFSSALVGTLTILVMGRLVRRLTGSTMLGCVAGLLLGFDALHFVMSRIALLDIFLAFWLLCATHCLVADRDWARLRLARRSSGTAPSPGAVGFGPIRGFLLRPWRIAAGVCFGLACGTKWSAAFVMAGMCLLVWAWDSGMRRAVGVRWAPLKALVADEIPALFSLIAVALVVYVVSWMGFLTHAQKFEDTFGQPSGDTPAWSSVDDFGGHPQGPFEGAVHDLDILWNYHKAVYDFHTSTYIQEAHHPFQSNPGGWLLINRPLGIDSLSGGPDTVPGCPQGQSCVRQILAIGTPALWWGGVVALFVGLGYWVFRRDWRFGIPIVGVLTAWLPWFRYDQRPIFFYYAVSIIPFTVIAVTLVLGKILGKMDATPRRRMVGVLFAGGFVALVALNFAYFYPILTDGLLTNAQWNHRMWLTHWI